MKHAGRFMVWARYGMIGLVIGYVAVNIAQLGGYAFVLSLNSTLTFVFSLVNAIFAVIVWKKVVGKQNRDLWGGFAAGIILWTLGELIWAVLSVLTQEVPYPSWADACWLAGYLPIFRALTMRIRTLPKVDFARRKIWFWIAAFVSVGWSLVFIIFPNLRASRFALDTFLNSVYPFMDLALLLLVLRILFTLQKGLYGKAWTWLSSAIGLRAVADLLFAYATTAGVYYSDGLNVLSTLGVDVPYALSYLIGTIGLVVMLQLFKDFPEMTEASKLVYAPLIPNTHVVLSTREDGTVIDVSGNCAEVFEIEKRKQTFFEVLGLSRDEAASIVKTIQSEGMLIEQTCRLKTRLGEKEAFISGIRILNPQQEYAGATFLVHLYLRETSKLDEMLTEQQRGLVRWLLEKTGIWQKTQGQAKQMLQAYYEAMLHALYRQMFVEGGSIFVDALDAELHTAAKAQGCQIQFYPHLVVISNLSVPEMRHILAALLEVARTFVNRTVHERKADDLLAQVRNQMGEEVLDNWTYVESSWLFST